MVFRTVSWGIDNACSELMGCFRVGTGGFSWISAMSEIVFLLLCMNDYNQGRLWAENSSLLLLRNAGSEYKTIRQLSDFFHATQPKANISHAEA